MQSEQSCSPLSPKGPVCLSLIFCIEILKMFIFSLETSLMGLGLTAMKHPMNLLNYQCTACPLLCVNFISTQGISTNSMHYK